MPGPGDLLTAASLDHSLTTVCGVWSVDPGGGVLVLLGHVIEKKVEKLNPQKRLDFRLG